MNKQTITKGLREVGACWAVSDQKYQGTSFNEDRPQWHIHPDCSYPHETHILRFDTLAEIAEWIEVCKKAAQAQTQEAAYDIWMKYQYQ